ncbi:hypothetical protein E2C01_076719 [Portunus trituberculatus]|uniref:Uncharacterized protein n=1 Tax=Portunus trituberculatus TaxID=210409 RepID=A0A5B7IPE7_PORTR|nr:hypothetical protein [Portunus trituberculatus]
MLARRGVWGNIPTCPLIARLSLLPHVPPLPRCACIVPAPPLAAMVSVVRVACGCGQAGCCGADEDCDGGGEGQGTPGPGDRPAAAAAAAAAASTSVQFSRQRRVGRTFVSASTVPLLRTHSCTNNSHPDIFTELQQQQEHKTAGEGRESEALSGAGEGDSVGGGGTQGRRHSAVDSFTTTEGGGLARHVWSHHRIARSLSREGFFLSPNEHHSALLRPLAALGDLTAACPDLSARLHYLTDLLGRRCPRHPSQEGGVLSPGDSLLLTTIARLHFVQQRPAPPGSTTSSSPSCPTTPDSVASSGWPSRLSTTTTTSEWPSRTSSLVSIASSLPEDDNTNDDGHDENLEEARLMAGGDLVAPLAHHYDHHAYHIYYGAPTRTPSTCLPFQPDP